MSFSSGTIVTCLSCAIHGEVYGVECQIFKNEEFLAAQRFDPRLDASRPSRDLAVQWAGTMRDSIQRGFTV